MRAIPGKCSVKAKERHGAVVLCLVRPMFGLVELPSRSANSIGQRRKSVIHRLCQFGDDHRPEGFVDTDFEGVKRQRGGAATSKQKIPLLMLEV